VLINSSEPWKVVKSIYNMAHIIQFVGKNKARVR
jgi:hypothetical protein